MKQSALERKIADMLRPVVEDKGLGLVCVTLQGAVLQVMAENPQTRNLGIDDCAALSREIAALLDVEDPIRGAYRLEVSSPGIDRPLVRLEDFADFAGPEVKIELAPPLDGQKRFRGVLQGTEGTDILLDTDTGPVRLPYGRIEKAKIVMTDALLKRETDRTQKETQATSERGTDD